MSILHRKKGDRIRMRVFRGVETQLCRNIPEEVPERHYHSSRDGRMIYHSLSLLFLSYLIWRRPVAGMLIGVLEGVWLLWPLYGLPEPLSFDVHLTLALTCLFAWREDDISHSVGLALAGASILGLFYHAPADATGTPTAVLGGVLCGEFVAAAWLIGRLVCRNHLEDRWARGTPLRRVLRALVHTNAPLGTGGEKALSKSDLHPTVSIASRT